MKKNYIHSSLYILAFLLFLMTSCNTRNPSNTSNNHIKTASIATDTTPDGNQQTIQFSNFPDFKVNSNDIAKTKANQIGEYLREIFEDKNGNLWFGTLEKGVARYDGKSLVYFTTEDGLAGNQINHIVEDKAGNIWFGTTNGVSMYDGKSFVNYRETEGLSNNSTWCMLIDKSETLWVSTISGVSRFDGTSFSDFSLPQSDLSKSASSRFSPKLVWSMIEDSKGHIWFGTDGVGVYKYNPLAEKSNDEPFTHFTKEDGLCNNNILRILEDKNGNLWFGSRTTRVQEPGKPYSFVDSDDAGLSCYNGKTFKQFPEVLGLRGKSISPIYEDKSGQIWIASMHYGAFRYDGEKFTLFREKLGLTNNCIQSILEDSKGNMWFGFSGGLFQWNGVEFRNITKDSSWF